MDEVVASNEDRLRVAIAAFARAWRDEAGRRPFDLLDGPAYSEKLVEIEDLLGAPLPPPVRIIFETFDGTYVPVSPERPDVVMFTSGIALRLKDAHTRDVVPIIECELDPETGIQRVLGVALADPWGPLKQGREPLGDSMTYDSDATTTLIGWFEQVTIENATYVWPEPKRITPSTEWTRRAQISEEDLRDMRVGAAIAVHRPDAKRHRIDLQLFVQFQPQVWVRGIHRKYDGSPSFAEMCATASEHIEHEIRRARSQWVLPPARIVPSLRHEMFVGTVKIE